MEIGHNVLHGQWDWMRDPKIHSTTWEWDHPAPAAFWKKSHNYEHHTFTNVRGKDRDLGYAVMRIVPEQEWKPAYLLQPLTNVALSLIFEYGVAIYDIELEKVQQGTKPWSQGQGRAQDALAQGAQADGQGLHPVPAAVRPGIPGHRGGQRHRERDPQRLVARGDLLRALPGRHRVLRRGAPGRRDQGRVVRAPDARLGQPVRRQAVPHHDREPVPPDRAPPVPGPAEQPVRARSPRGSARSASATACRTPPARCPPSTARSCARSSGSRCRRPAVSEPTRA